MNFRTSLEEASGKLACTSARSIRTLTQTIADLPGGVLNNSARDGAFNLERLYCDKDPFTEPFRPALCPILYTVTVTYRKAGNVNPADNGTFSLSAIRWGEVGTATVRRFTSEEGVRGDRASIWVVDGGAENITPQPPVAAPFVGTQAIDTQSTFVVLGINSVPYPPGADGTCELSPVPIPYKPEEHTYPVPITYTPPGGVQITIPFVAVVGLFYVDANLNLNMPVTFQVDARANIDIDFNPKIQVTLNLSTGETQVDWVTGTEPNTPPPALPPSSRPPFTSPTNPAPPRPPSVPDVEPDEEDIPQGRVLIGVIVTSTYNGNNSNVGQIFQTDSPNVFIPYLGLVSFAVRAAGDSTGWTNDIPVKNQRAFIPAPPVPGVIAVRGTPRPPNTWVLTPVYEKRLVLAGG